jgi:hypothetical protein
VGCYIGKTQDRRLIPERRLNVLTDLLFRKRDIRAQRSGRIAARPYIRRWSSFPLIQVGSFVMNSPLHFSAHDPFNAEMNLLGLCCG